NNCKRQPTSIPSGALAERNRRRPFNQLECQTRGLSMANPEHLKVLSQGSAAWESWRKENPDAVPDLSNVSFNMLNLMGIDLSRANLRESTFGRTNLTGANLEQVDLSEAAMYEADLRFARLIGAKLVRTNLFRANLNGTNLSDADLTGAELS